MFFVTWRLFGSIPRVKSASVFSGPLWLQDPQVAASVAATLQDGEKQWGLYTLSAWVLMPNHVHTLLTPMIVRSFNALMTIKSASARRANLILGRTGKPFWQVESYDHWVRSDDDESRIVGYIESNPVRAGLVAAVEDWRWSSAWNGR
ncbi:MAG: transposase [Acidobacteriota bacterium]|nr:transposase [Acidobacteriota bacterium]